MLKNLFVCFSVFSGILLSAGTGEIIAAWNFQDNSALKGKFPVKLRGKTVLDKSGLHVPVVSFRQSGGAILLKNSPALSPADAFEITAQLVLDADAGKVPGRRMIYDAKYVPAPNSAAQKKYHRGFMFFLVSNGKNIFRPGAAFGFGDSSIQSYGKNIELIPGRKHLLSMLFNATGKVSFYVDGKLNHTGNIPAGKVAFSGITPVLGDRAGANYQPLQGRLLKHFSADAAQKENYYLSTADAVSYLNSHYEQKVSIAKLCAIAGMSKAALMQNFARSTGTTPLQYQLNLRIAEAVILLRSTNNSISEIAMETGFSDTNYFGRQFKRITGSSPGEYRKKCRNTGKE